MTYNAIFSYSRIIAFAQSGFYLNTSIFTDSGRDEGELSLKNIQHYWQNKHKMMLIELVYTISGIEIRMI